MRGEIVKELIGRKVVAVFVSEGEGCLKFETNKGDVFYEGYGGCCSETWFSDIIGLHSLLGNLVCAVDKAELSDYNEEDGRGRQKWDSVYGFKITSTGGYTDIVFRNSSNGYYGGNAEFCKSVPHGIKFIKIESDDWYAQ